MSIEELAFKDRKILANLNAVDLLNIIKFLQDDRRQCLEELSKTHNRSVEIQKENQELKSQLAGTTHCFDEEKHNKLKEENQELKKQLHEASLTIQEMTEQDIECPSNCEKLRQLKKQLEEYKKLGFKHLQDKNNNLETQQKEFIKYLEDEKNRLSGTCDIICVSKFDEADDNLQEYKRKRGYSEDE